MAASTYYDPRSRTFKRRKSRKRRRRRRTSGIGSFGATFGQSKSLTGIMSSYKGILMTGAIAAGGVVFTDTIYDKLGARLNLAGWQREVAKLLTGFALAFLVAKVLKKPKLGAAVAIGPTVAFATRMFADVMKKPAFSGLGLTTLQPAIPQFGMGSLEQYGGNVPVGVQFPGAKPRSYYGMNGALAGAI